MSALAKRMTRTLRTAIGGGLLLIAGLAQANTVHYYYTDPQGTVLAKADAQGAIVARYDYTPYGTSAPNLDAAPAGPGYTGHVNDPDTGLVYMQARYYDPVVGRFMSEDPAGMAPSSIFSFNRYDYANNNPVVNIDPFGEKCTSSVAGRYSCTVDENTGKFSHSQIVTLNKAYTKAVNALESHSGQTVTVAVNGKSFKANAGSVARALINAHIDTSSEHGSKGGEDRGSTYAGGIGSDGIRLAYQPQTKIYKNALERDRSGGTSHVDGDLSLTFVHEGIHMLPGESVMYKMYYRNPNKYEHDHQNAFNRASKKLYGTGN